MEGDFEAYEWVHADRYEQRSGPLRPVVRRSVFAYLDCGRLHGGFARIRGPKCRTEGVLTTDGRFHPVIWPGKRTLEEGSCRRFLALLEKAGRLSSSFHATLLSWRHSGFSVDASQRVAAGEDVRLERLAR